MELSPTAYVILGTLGWRPMSGYEIKSIVDKSTRFFWAASYGQIYPELRRLAAAGLIEGKASPQGGRRRNVYRLTPAGRKELRAWLEARLRAAGFTDVWCWLSRVDVDPGDPVGYLRAICLGSFLERLPEELHPGFVAAALERLEEPVGHPLRPAEHPLPRRP